jgi:arylsulfatase A-like enzyme
VNIVLIVLDTLRADHVGAYGNNWIHTPNMDAFARQAVRFTRAYPESLPTLPVRRALHTARRTFPYHGHRHYKGDFVGAPGWGPIPEEQETVAEALGEQGYRCALITDTYHQFKPSKNFHRGFHHWAWVRGQETDPFRSGPPVPVADIQRHMDEKVEDHASLAAFIRACLRNNTDRLNEEGYFAPRVFTEASRWLWDNQDADPFFLVVDSFDPHEPWDPPVYYRKMYDPDDDAVDVIQTLYGPWPGKMAPREVRRMQANYAGEVTMVDRWLGYFLETLRLTGRSEDTIVAIMSDHGHNIGHDPGDKQLISKQGHPMTHAVADLVMMVRHPKGVGAGTVSDILVYDHDLVATLLGLAGATPPNGAEGIDFWPGAAGQPRAIREHVTIGWGPLVTVITDKWWYNASIWGEGELLNLVKEDPALERNLAAEHPGVCAELRGLAIQDAGGVIPEAFANYHNKPGCTPFEVRYR